MSPTTVQILHCKGLQIILACMGQGLSHSECQWIEHVFISNGSINLSICSTEKDVHFPSEGQRPERFFKCDNYTNPATYKTWKETYAGDKVGAPARAEDPCLLSWRVVLQVLHCTALERNLPCEGQVPGSSEIRRPGHLFNQNQNYCKFMNIWYDSIPFKNTRPRVSFSKALRPKRLWGPQARAEVPH